jgi:hypothetical protein
MKPEQHYGYYKDGRWHLDSFKDALRALQSKPVVLTVHEFVDKRSLQANNYYWKVMEWMGEGLKDLGWEPKKCSKEAVHKMMAAEFLTIDEHVKDGVFLKRTRSTTELDKQEFAAYLEHVIQYAAENVGIIIPPPGEQMEIAA